MPEKTPKPLPSRPPPWPDQFPSTLRSFLRWPRIRRPWWPCPWYDPAPPWWDRLELPDQARLIAARLAYKRSELQAKLVYVEVLMETLK